MRTLLYISVLVLGVAFAEQSNAGAPQIEHWLTSNGARVYFVAAPEIPIVDIRVVFAAGSARDGTQSGLANLTNGLLKEGAGDLDADAFSDRLGATGAIVDTGAERDMAYASLRSLSDEQYLRPALDLFNMAIAKPRFDPTALERRKARIIVALKHKQQSPDAVVEDTFFASLYGTHPYGSPPDGTEASVAALTRSDVVGFHQRYYVAANAVIAIVGAVDKAQAQALAETLSTALAAGERAAELPAVAPPKAQEKHVEFPSIQSHVRVGMPLVTRNDPDYFPLLVGNHALGGNSLVSVLFREIRNKRGLSYSAYSFLLPMARPGPFMAELQTDRSQQDEAMKVLRATLKDFAQQGPPTEDLLAAKQNLIGGFPLRINSNDRITEYIAMIGFYDLPLDYLETFVAKVEAVTPEAVKEAYGRRIAFDQLITIIVGRAVNDSGS